MLTPRPCVGKLVATEPRSASLEKAIEDASLAADILEREEAEASSSSFEDWGMYNFMEEEDEEATDEEFNLCDSDVAGNMSADETLALIRMAGIYSGDTEPLERDRSLLLQQLQLAIRHYDDASATTTSRD